MKIQKFFLVVMVFFAFTLSSEGLHAQGATYTTAAGLRLGYPLSASIKHFIKDDIAVEGYVGFRGFSGYNWVSVSGAVQVHNPIESVDGLQWYWGGGASAFFYSFDNSFFGDTSTSTAFGIQGYLGLDYAFEDIPLNITADWIPTIFLNGIGSGFGAGYGTLGVRYILNQ